MGAHSHAIKAASPTSSGTQNAIQISFRGEGTVGFEELIVPITGVSRGKRKGVKYIIKVL